MWTYEIRNKEKVFTAVQIVSHHRWFYFNESFFFNLFTIKTLLNGNEDFLTDIQMHGNCCYSTLTENCFQPYNYLLSCYVSQYCLLVVQPYIHQVIFHLFLSHFYSRIYSYDFLTLQFKLCFLLWKSIFGLIV